MKRFSILFCLVLLLNVLCPAGHVHAHAESITTSTDLCTHTNYGYWADGADCVYGCLDCKKESSRGTHAASCANPGVCATCDYENASLTADHSWNADGVCSECGTSCSHSSWKWNWQNDQHSKTCSECGATFDAGAHNLELALDQTDENSHWYACSICTFVLSYEEHKASCTNPGVCATCGYEDADMDVTHNHGNWADGDECVFGCLDCKQELFCGVHIASCIAPGVCSACGYEGDILAGHYITTISDGEAGHHSECLNCGEINPVFGHTAACNAPGVCTECGYEGEIEGIEHNYEVVDKSAEGHTWKCVDCDAVKLDDHFALCDDPSRCWVCGYEGAIDESHVTHYFPNGHGVWEGYDETNHWYICAKCGETKKMPHAGGTCSEETSTCVGCGATYTHPHTWGDPVVVDATATTDGSKTYTCTECGATKEEVIPATGSEATATPTVEPTAEPTTEPTAEPTAEPEATATPDLDYEPDETATPAPTAEPVATATPNLDYEPDETAAPVPTAKPAATAVPDDEPAEPVHVHSYGACVPTGSGSHTQTCTDCGSTVSTTCTMVDTAIGNLNASACVYCGYITWELDVITEDTQEEIIQEGKQDGKVVANVVFDVVNETGESVLTESMSLTVYESAPEATVQLDNGVHAIVKKALTVTMLEDSAPVKLTNTVKLSIPVEDDLTGLKLLVVDENGELVEIEYEVIDGVMVFETDILGIFMLVEEI